MRIPKMALDIEGHKNHFDKGSVVSGTNSHVITEKISNFSQNSPMDLTLTRAKEFSRGILDRIKNT